MEEKIIFLVSNGNSLLNLCLVLPVVVSPLVYAVTREKLIGEPGKAPKKPYQKGHHFEVSDSLSD